MNNKKAERHLEQRRYSPQFKDQALEGIAKDGVRQGSCGSEATHLHPYPDFPLN